MAFYQYRAADHAGKIVEGIMEADAEQGVVLRLHEMGCIPLRIACRRECGRWLHRRAPLFPKRKINQQQLLQFTQELGTLLAAGLPLDRSLSILGNLIEGEEFSKVMRTLLGGRARRQVTGGFDGRTSGCFPENLHQHDSSR